MDATSNAYFATLPGAELLPHLQQRFKDFEGSLRACRDYYQMLAATREYYGLDTDGNPKTSEISKAGDMDQLRTFGVGHFRTVVRNKLTIASADTPNWTPVPRNTDHTSQGQAQICKGIIEYEMRKEDGDEAKVDLALEGAEILKWVWLDAYWDAEAGEQVDEVPQFDASGNPSGNVPIFVGEPKTEVHLPIDVAFEIAQRQALIEHVQVRYYHNKHNVAAELERRGRKEDAEAVRALSTSPAREDFIELTGKYGKAARDEIAVFEFRHMRTPACPNGRLLRYAGNVVIADSEDPERWIPGWSMGLPYKDLSILQVKTAVRLGTPRGYTQAHDALGLALVVDALTSIAYSNGRALGGNFIWTQGGKKGIKAEDLTQALTILESPTKPEVLELCKTPPEVFAFRREAMQDMESGQGMDALSMGRDERQLSGAAMALLDTRTQRAVSDLAKTRTNAMRWIANAKIRLYQKFATVGRVLPLIVGKMKAPMLKEFSAQDVEGIDRVMIEETSPIMRSPAGRLEIATQLVAKVDASQQPLINQQQFLALIETGKLEPLTEGPQAELMAIRDENERLSRGEALEEFAPAPPVPMGPPGMPPPAPVKTRATAIFTDNHPLHIREHATVLASADARGNPQVVANVRTHLDAHITVWMETAPAILASLGIPPPPLPMPPPGMAGPPAPGGGSDETQPPGAGGPPSGAPPPKPGDSSKTKGAPGGPALPTMPNGEQYSPTGAVNT